MWENYLRNKGERERERERETTISRLNIIFDLRDLETKKINNKKQLFMVFVIILPIFAQQYNIFGW